MDLLDQKKAFNNGGHHTESLEGNKSAKFDFDSKGTRSNLNNRKIHHNL